MEQQSTIKEIIQARTIEKLSRQLSDKSVQLAEAEAKGDLYRELLEQKEQEVAQLQQEAEEIKKKLEKPAKKSTKTKATEDTQPSTEENVEVEIIPPEK